MERAAEYTVWQLAGMAGTASPDGVDSAGADWLRRVAGDAAELLERLEEGEDTSDAIHELSDAAVPIYTHNRWEVFVDLAAYQEDVTEFGPFDDMERAAGVALYVIACRLLAELLEDADR